MPLQVEDALTKRKAANGDASEKLASAYDKLAQDLQSRLTIVTESRDMYERRYRAMCAYIQKILFQLASAGLKPEIDFQEYEKKLDG